MHTLSVIAAAGVWPAVLVTGYLVFAFPQRVWETAKLPAVTAYAITAAVGIALWSVPLLGALLAGAFHPTALGILGWGVSAIGLMVAFGRATRRAQLPSASARARSGGYSPASQPELPAAQSRHGAAPAGGRRASRGEASGRRRVKETPKPETSAERATDAANPDIVWDGLLIAGLVVAAALYLGFPTESIGGGRDEGVYANQAIYFAQHGRRDIRYPWPEDANTIFADAWLGFPGFYNTSGTMTPQFSQLLPVWLAQAFTTFGHHGLFRLNAVFALLSLAVFYGVCHMVVSRPYAVVATFFLAFNPSQLWMARLTLTETLTQLFIWSSLLLLVQALREGKPSLARWAGVFVGCAALVRFDGLILVPLLFLAHAAFTIVTATGDPLGGESEPRGLKGQEFGARSSTVWNALYQTAVPLSGVTVAYYAFFSAPYFREVGQFYLTKLVVSTVIALLVLLASAVPFVRRLRPWVTSKALLTVVCVAVCGLAAYAYWLRPTASDHPVWKYERVGYSFDVSRDYRQDSLVNLGRYVSPPVVLAAIAGWLLCLWMLARQRRNPHLVPPLVVIAGCAAVYLWDPAVYPDHYWAIRRFVPVVIPGFVLYAAAAAAEATRRVGSPWARGLEALALVFLCLFTFGAGQLIFTFAEDSGFFLQLQDLARKLPDDQVVVTHGYKTWVMPLYVAFDRKVVPVDLNTEPARKAKEEWVARQTKRQLPAYLLVEVDQSSTNPLKVGEAELRRSYTQPTTDPLPRKIITMSQRMELYKVGP